MASSRPEVDLRFSPTLPVQKTSHWTQKSGASYRIWALQKKMPEGKTVFLNYGGSSH